MIDLNGKNAIVTGGCFGIGFELTKYLLEQDVQTIGLFDINKNEIAIDQLRIVYPKQSIEYYHTDVRYRNEIQKSLKQFQMEFKYIDLLINCAGYANENYWEDIILLNTMATVNCTYETMDIMSKAYGGRGGLIINIVSMSGIYSQIYLPVYSATKSANLVFTKTMANDINNDLHGIQFMAICPGKTITNFITDSKSKFRPEFQDVGEKDYSAATTQTCKQLIECVGALLPISTNGSIWIIFNGKYWEFTKANDIMKEVLKKKL